jgi:hypothetical protein
MKVLVRKKVIEFPRRERDPRLFPLFLNEEFGHFLMAVAQVCKLMQPEPRSGRDLFKMVFENVERS